MKLSDREWKSIKLFDIGDISSGRDIYESERMDGDTPYITSGSMNNGIGYFVGNMNETYDEDFIAMNRNGAVGQAFYHPYRALLGNDCRKFHLKEYGDNLYIGLFIALTISNQKSCFSYSRKLGTNRANAMKIMLPVDENGNIDYEFMQEYIREIAKNKCLEYQNYCRRRLKELGEIIEIEKLSEKEWKEFFLVDIFSKIQRGKRLKNVDHIAGRTPYASSSAFNNGIDDFIGNELKVRKYKNCLSLANSGSVGSCFYEPFEFVASDHVTHLQNENFSMYTYLFIATMARRLSGKYNFNREINDTRIRREKVLLPIKSDETPDYSYMEQYAKNMMIRKYKEYLAYKMRKGSEY